MSERTTEPPPPLNGSTLEIVHEELIATRVSLGEQHKRLDNFAERAEQKADEISHTLSGLATNQLAFDTRQAKDGEKIDALISDVRETKASTRIVEKKIDSLTELVTTFLCRLEAREGKSA